jgi:O-antigen/teichoic acid export membrane protein
MLNSIKSFIKQTFIYGFVGGLKSFVEFLLLPIYARCLLPSQYGQLDLILVFSAIASAAVIFELTTGVFRFYYDSDSPSYHCRLMSTITIYHTAAALAVFVAIAVFSNKISALLYNDSSYGPLLILAGVLLVLNCAVTLPINLLRLQNKPGTYTIISLIQIAITIAGTIYFVAFLKLGISGVVISRVISYVPVLVATLWIQRKYLRFQFDSSILIKILKYSAPLIPVGSAIWLINGLNRVFLLKYCSLEEIGLFSVGLKFTIFLTLLVMAFQLAWPQFAFSRMKKEKAGRLFARIFSYFCAACLWMVIFVGLFGKPLLKLQTVPAYYPAVSVMLPLALAMMFYGIFYIFTTAMNITGKTMTVLIPVVLGFFSNIVLNLLISPTGGATAIAWITTATYVIMAIITFILAQKQYYIPFEWQKLGRLAIAGASIGVISRFLPQASLIGEILSKSALFLGFPLLLGLLRFFEPAELKFFSGNLTINRAAETKIEKEKENENAEVHFM